MKTLLLIFLPLLLFGQDDYECECSKFIEVAFYEAFEYGKVDNQFVALKKAIDQSEKINFKKYHCADSVWVELGKDKRPKTFVTHGTTPTMYLRKLVSKVDSLVLDKEFKDLKLKSNLDSFNYVVNKVNSKRLRYSVSKTEHKKFYFCIDAEVMYLRKNKTELMCDYLSFYDDSCQDYYVRGIILSSLAYSNNYVEHEIWERIEKVDDSSFFRRMTGILRTSGGIESINYFESIIGKIKEEYKIKSLAETVYGILSRNHFDKVHRDKFENILKKNNLERLIRES